MKPRDLGELLALAALWGASFLFMRLGAGEFGPVALAGLRVVGATLFLLPLLVARGQLSALRTHWRAIFVVGSDNKIKHVEYVAEIASHPNWTRKRVPVDNGQFAGFPINAEPGFNRMEAFKNLARHFNLLGSSGIHDHRKIARHGTR